MTLPFPIHFKEIADDMGIALYQRFSLDEASLFLSQSEDEVKMLVQLNNIGSIQLSPNNIQFFGHQLIHYLLEQTCEPIQTKLNPNNVDRIIRAKEVQELTGLSRVTLWRREKGGEFPKRVSLGANSVGWKLSEVQSWISERQ